MQKEWTLFAGISFIQLCHVSSSVPSGGLDQFTCLIESQHCKENYYKNYDS